MLPTPSLGDKHAGSRGMLALLLGASILGFAAIFVRWASPAGPAAIGFFRMLIALPAILLLVWRSQETSAEPSRGRPWAMLGGLLFTADLILWHGAMNRTSAANATLLVGLAPLWVNLFMVFFLKAQLRKQGWLGLVLALGGASILALAKGARLGSGHGELMALGASFCYGGYTLCLARARRHLAPLEALAWVVPVCVMGFAIMGWVMGDAFVGFPPKAWLALLGLGLVVQVMAWWLISWSLGQVSAGLGSITLLIQPVATVFLGWMLLGESIKPIQGLGASLVLAGIGFSVMNPSKPAT